MRGANQNKEMRLGKIVINQPTEDADMRTQQ